MPANINLANLTPLVVVNDIIAPRIWTKEAYRDGTRPAPPVEPGAGTLIFSESFDSQADWHSGLIANDLGGIPAGLPDRQQLAETHTIPTGWDGIIQDPTWAPSVGHGDRHESIEILASNSDKARGGTGKSYVSWRDYYDPGWNRFNSDSMMVKLLDTPLDEVYLEFYVKFSSDWSETGISKIARISHIKPSATSLTGFGTGDHGPVLFYDYINNNYGLRNALAFRSGGDRYNITSNDIHDLPRSLSGIGDYAGNFTSNVQNGVYGTPPQIPDLLNGGFLPTSGDVLHKQVLGTDWNKVGLYVKINSAPGVLDGVFKQFHNDILILETNKVSWVNGVIDPMPKWNYVAIGGNDFWRGYTNAERREEWYAIDDVKIYSGLPEALL